MVHIEKHQRLQRHQQVDTTKSSVNGEVYLVCYSFLDSFQEVEVEIYYYFFSVLSLKQTVVLRFLWLY